MPKKNSKAKKAKAKPAAKKAKKTARAVKNAKNAKKNIKRAPVKSKPSKKAKEIKTQHGKKAKKQATIIKGPANMLVTFDPGHIGSSKREVANILKQVNKEAKIVKEHEGSFQLYVKAPRETAKALSAVCKTNPSLFNYTFHWVPIDKWCKANIKEMQKEIGKYENKIGETERWKMQLNKRSFPTPFKDLILQLTLPIDRRFVDLENPQKIVQVEILGKQAGISLLAPDEFLDVPKVKVGAGS